MCSAVGDEDNADPTWRNSGVTASQIRRVFRKERCLDCILAKRNLDPPSTNEQKQYAPGECISADPSGSISPAGPRGEKFSSYLKILERVTSMLSQARLTTANLFLKP